MILLAAGDFQIDPLDRVVQLGKLLAGKLQTAEFGQRRQQRRSQSRRAAQAAAGRRIGADVDIDSPVHVEPLDRRLGQIKSAVVRRPRVEVVVNRKTQIERANPHLPVVARVKRHIRIAVNRRRENRARMLLVPGRHIGAAAGEADPQRRFRADDVALQFLAGLQRGLFSSQDDVRHCGIFPRGVFDRL